MAKYIEGFLVINYDGVEPIARFETKQTGLAFGERVETRTHSLTIGKRTESGQDRPDYNAYLV